MLEQETFSTNSPVLCAGLEAVVPPVMQLYFDFGDLANSLLYLGCGLQLILVFLLLSAASKAGDEFLSH